MDFSRRMYSTDCRFFEDSDAVDTIEWKEVPESAPVLPFESAFLMKQQEPDDWLPGGVGEVAGAERVTTLARAPTGLGRGHICGTPEDFARGATYDPTRPPVQYGANGYPLCCFPPLRLRGGAGASGRSAFALVPPVKFRGGAACSGRSAYAVVPATVPGASCAAAAVIAVGPTYGASHPGGAVAHWWFLPFAVTGDLYRIIGDADIAVAEGYVRGGPCPNPATFYLVDWDGCQTIVSFAPGLFVYVESNTGEPFTYSFRIELGACP